MHFRKGSLLLEAGRTEDATSSLKRAVSCDERLGAAQLALARVAVGRDREKQLVRLRDLLREADALTPEDRSGLEMACSELCRRLGLTQEAFSHLASANRIRSSITTYRERRTHGRLNAIMLAELPSTSTEPPPPRPSIIFIVGMPRTGSTLIEQVLCTNPRVISLGETNLVQQAIAAAEPDILSDRFPSSLARWAPEDIEAFRTFYRRRVDEAIVQTSRDVAYVVDKMLSNFQYVGLIKSILPEARVIVTTRDPTETCLACYTTFFSSIKYSFNIGQIVRYFKKYAEVVRYWSDRLPPDALVQVSLEALVEDFDAEFAKLCALCGMEPWSGAHLFYANHLPVRTASTLQVRRPLYKDKPHVESVPRWLHQAIRQALTERVGEDDPRGSHEALEKTDPQLTRVLSEGRTGASISP